MKVPEKIYIDHHPFRDEYEEYWYSAPAGYKSVEYIRTDAFIEKACVWIKEKWDDNYTMPIIIDSVIEDFKSFMKGE